VTELEVSRKIFEDLRKRTARGRAALGTEGERISMQGPYPWHNKPKQDERPPEWAQDPFNEHVGYRCPRCNEWEEVVRPGKTQCRNPKCVPEDDGFDTVYPPCDTEPK